MPRQSAQRDAYGIKGEPLILLNATITTATDMTSSFRTRGGSGKTGGAGQDRAQPGPHHEASTVLGVGGPSDRSGAPRWLRHVSCGRLHTIRQRAVSIAHNRPSHLIQGRQDPSMCR